ncbi:MAG: hypothetical protein BGO52_15130 [Sphingobacteriales bacterium 44-61]|nr:MAG: hypothetical protein BGO52_15130 [Sphingobacteriales bacterium 44-61]
MNAKVRSNIEKSKYVIDFIYFDYAVSNKQIAFALFLIIKNNRLLNKKFRLTYFLRFAYCPLA